MFYEAKASFLLYRDWRERGRGNIKRIDNFSRPKTAVAMTYVPRAAAAAGGPGFLKRSAELIDILVCPLHCNSGWAVLHLVGHR